MPTLLVVAGPNGCGKSTLARMSAFGGLEVIDPDAIAHSMTSGNPTHAPREALRFPPAGHMSWRLRLPVPAFFAT